MNGLKILSIAPSATVQDRGREGYLRFGVTGGGAVDVYALAEGQALLGNRANDAALEFAGFGGRFRAGGTLWLASSGAEMAISLNGAPLAWRQSFRMEAGDILDIGSALSGVYGYLHVAGGFLTEVVLGSRSTHLRAGFGHVPRSGQVLKTGGGDSGLSPTGLPKPDYFARRELRFLAGPQTRYFSKDTLAAFLADHFKVSAKRDRMGVQISPDCGPVRVTAGLTIASDAINLGDIQITGDGTPAVLLADRGSSGGYPRIGTIISADLPTLAQIPAGEGFTLMRVERAEAVAALAEFRAEIKALPGLVRPMLRDPRDIADLLAYNLIDGVLRGDEHDPN
jgi:biotin-dependent carboxylase-like uncharacterized protein